MSDDPIENYSPFDNTSPEQTSISNNSYSTIPSTMQSAGSTSLQTNIDDITEEELRAYEQRLNLLESKLNAKEVQIKVSGNSQEPLNWPFFYPIVHFSIEEVPSLLRPYVKDSLYAWICSTITFMLNWFGCISLLGAKIDKIQSPGSKIALSTLYLFIGIPLSLDLNFLAVFRILKSDSSNLSYFKLFLTLGVTIIFEIILSFGFDDSGSVGLISMITIFSGKAFFTGFLALFTTLGLILSILFHVKLLREIWNYFKGTDQGGHLEDDIKGKVLSTVADAFSNITSLTEGKKFDQV